MTHLGSPTDFHDDCVLHVARRTHMVLEILPFYFPGQVSDVHATSSADIHIGIFGSIGIV